MDSNIPTANAYLPKASPGGTTHFLMSTDHPTHHQDKSTNRLPKWLVYAIIAVTALPGILILTGVDISTAHGHLDYEALGKLPQGEAADSVFKTLVGAFSHVILEWSAVVAAAGAFLLCIANWSVQRNSLLPIIGVALLCAGSLDAFHTLAATRMIEASADNNQLIPFTWALARAFDLAITTIGVGLCLKRKLPDWMQGGRLICVSTIAFLSFSYAVIHICATSANLPQTQFPDAVFTRPWDAFPLFGWIAATYFVIWPYHKQKQNSFSHSLMLAVIPQVATEIHMAFGSSALFDANFNAAHFLKIVAYSTPVAGLLIEYIRTLRAQQGQLIALEEADQLLRMEHESLALANLKLQARNAELDEFAYVASHDLQEPLRKLTAYSDLLVLDVGEDLSTDAKQDVRFITEAAERMSILIADILALSRENAVETDNTPVDLAEAVDQTLADLAGAISSAGATVDVAPLPTIMGDPRAIGQLFNNLISNALKYVNGSPPHIEINSELDGDFFIISIADNGIGIPQEHREDVFAPFKRLHGRGEYEGTGIGLSICKKSVTRMGGEIWAEGREGHGSRFRFSLPKSKCAKRIECTNDGTLECSSARGCSGSDQGTSLNT